MHKPNILILATVVLIGSFYLATLRDGNIWGGDCSLYVAHARNLVEGRDYADTGYIYNPHFPSLSPRTYPPVFPLLLTPVYLLFGMNLTAMNVFVVLHFMAFLWVLSLLLRRHLSLPYVMACLLLVGLNPYYWQHKDRLLSEMPFMLFVYLALLLIEKAHEPGRTRLWVWGLATGAVAFLAFGTRTVGVILIPSLIACELVRTRRLGSFALTAVATFTVGVLLEKLLLILDGSYLDQVTFDPLLSARIALSEVKALLALFVENHDSLAVSRTLSICVLALAGLTCLVRLRSGLRAYDWFVVFNFLLLTVYPDAEGERRYQMPVMPLLFLYVCEGLSRLRMMTWGRFVTPVAATLGLAVLVSYANRYHHLLEAGPVRATVNTTDSVELFDYIKAHTRPDDVFLIEVPRTLALYTGRRASGFHVPPSDEHLLNYLREIGATHVVLCRKFTGSQNVLEPFLERQAERFDQVYAGGQFVLYRVRQDAVARR